MELREIERERKRQIERERRGKERKSEGVKKFVGNKKTLIRYDLGI